MIVCPTGNLCVHNARAKRPVGSTVLSQEHNRKKIGGAGCSGGVLLFTGRGPGQGLGLGHGTSRWGLALTQWAKICPKQRLFGLHVAQQAARGPTPEQTWLGRGCAIGGRSMDSDDEASNKRKSSHAHICQILRLREAPVALGRTRRRSECSPINNVSPYQASSWVTSNWFPGKEDNKDDPVMPTTHSQEQTHRVVYPWHDNQSAMRK